MSGDRKKITAHFVFYILGHHTLTVSLPTKFSHPQVSSSAFRTAGFAFEKVQVVMTSDEAPMATTAPARPGLSPGATTGLVVVFMVIFLLVIIFSVMAV